MYNEIIEDMFINIKEIICKIVSLKIIVYVRKIIWNSLVKYKVFVKLVFWVLSNVNINLILFLIIR